MNGKSRRTSTRLTNPSGARKSGLMSWYWRKAPQLRLEALVDRDLRLVGLDLAEVGVQREVDGECILHDDLAVDPGPDDAVCLERRPLHIEEPGAREGAVRNELVVPSGRHVA